MPVLRTRSSSLGHPLEHSRCHPIRDLAAAEELLQILQYHVRDLLPHVESAAGNVGRDDGARHTAQWIVHTERLDGIGHIESTARRPARTCLRRALRSIKPPPAELIDAA